MHSNIENNTKAVKDLAAALGFDIVGITSALDFDDFEVIALERLESGLMDGLPWYNAERVKRGSKPSELLPGARSIISLAMSYMTEPPSVSGNAFMGKVGRYAWGPDYHKVMWDRMSVLIDSISRELQVSMRAKTYCDTGPMLDRAVAKRAGVGWYGKNTNILSSSHGSWIFLGQIITDLVLQPDSESKKTCGQCTTCIDMCPTGAIIAPYVLDNSKCISFLTIECRGEIPIQMRPLIGDWVFGCDICQDVCPVNRKAKPTREPAFQVGEHGFTSLELIPLLSITDLEFKQRFANSPIRRAKRSGLVRNVCVALGNIGDISAIPALIHTLKDKDPMVRSHCAWAIGQIGGSLSYKALEVALQEESDDDVVAEITLALDQTNQIIKTTI